MLGPSLTAEEAEVIFARGKEAVVFALLELAKQLAQQQQRGLTTVSPSTPSGMIPPYQKPPANGRKKRPGRKAVTKARVASRPRGSTAASNTACSAARIARAN
jgi:transcription initiation factor TFIID subunit TAF12